MSVLGSQVDVDMDESVPDPVPKHQGHTGTGCYKLHDHEFMRPKHRVTSSGAGGKPETADKGPPTNIMDLPVDGGGQQAVQQLKHMASPAHRSPVRWSRFHHITLGKFQSDLSNVICFGMGSQKCLTIIGFS